MKRVATSDTIQDFYEFMDDAASFKGWGESTLAGELRSVNGLLKDVFHELGDISRNEDYNEQYPELWSELMEIRKLVVSATNRSANLIDKYKEN